MDKALDENMKKAVIMVVDDTPVNLKLLQEILHTKGYRVVAFTQGAIALEAALNNPPDLILLDIFMPGINGYEVCERLKAEETLREIPVLFISALTDTRDKVRAYSVGGIDYITKPFQADEINVRVETHLNLYRQKKQLQEAYDKLSALEVLRDNLMHMVAHDMRSPLQAIMGYMELAQLDTLPSKIAGYIDIVSFLSNTLNEMIANLLSISRMEEGPMPLNLAKTDVIGLMNETIVMFQPIKDQRTITIAAFDKMEKLMIDPEIIKRVFQNLIGNAIKITDKKDGVITVSIESKADNLFVSITDNGSGIPPEHCDKIFDKFYQTEGRKQGYLGAVGLGLTFCKLAVEAHNGSIGIKSGVGKGNTFYFHLPVSGTA